MYEDMNVIDNNLIIIPYAYGGNTGVSIQNVDRQLEIYLKNVCVAAISAKKNAGKDSDVMIVSNISLPEPYISILQSNRIMIENCPFNKFNFGQQTRSGKKVRWQLAYYKLCALSHCLDNYQYNNYCFLDSDVYIQRSFDRIWTDAKHNIMLYDVNEPADGYMVQEMQSFLNNDKLLTHYGGEFFAATRSLALDFIRECDKIFTAMKENDFVSENGDEFITSLAAARLKERVKNAGAYIRRYWTGSYRLVCNDFDKNNIVVLHVPAEKEHGIIKLYKKFISKDRMPKNQIVWHLLNLYRPSLRVQVGRLLRKIGLFK